MRGGVTIDYKTYIRYPRKVSIGTGSTINRGCRFYASHYYKDVRIRIGRHVAVAPEVSFFAAGHDYRELGLPDTGVPSWTVAAGVPARILKTRKLSGNVEHDVRMAD